MDTVFVTDTIELIDTLLVVPVEIAKSVVGVPEFGLGDWIALVVACATVIGLILNQWWAWRTEIRAGRLRFTKEWEALFEERSYLRDLLKDSYKKWCFNDGLKYAESSAEHLPKVMEDLFKEAGIPNNLSSAHKDIDKYWSDLGTGDLRAKQAHDFVGRIVPTRGGPSAIWIDLRGGNALKNEEQFRVRRSKLAYALSGWAETLPKRYLYEKLKSHPALVAEIIWIELALVNDVGDAWADQPYLFKFVRWYWKKYESEK